MTKDQVKDLPTERLQDWAAELETQLSAYAVWQERREIRPLSFVVTTWTPTNANVRKQQLRAILLELASRQTKESLARVLAAAQTHRTLQHYKGLLAEAQEAAI